jgi:3-phosphoshikimate 1-carboxyvinyltransferase
MGDDFLEVIGGIKQKDSATKIKTSMDHRIAMSFLVMGLTMEGGTEIDDTSMIATSFPEFEKIFENFGSGFSEVIS